MHSLPTPDMIDGMLADAGLDHMNIRGFSLNRTVKNFVLGAPKPALQIRRFEFAKRHSCFLPFFFSGLDDGAASTALYQFHTADSFCFHLDPARAIAIGLLTVKPLFSFTNPHLRLAPINLQMHRPFTLADNPVKISNPMRRDVTRLVEIIVALRDKKLADFVANPQNETQRLQIYMAMTTLADKSQIPGTSEGWAKLCAQLSAATSEDDNKAHYRPPLPQNPSCGLLTLKA
jgi:hypothetical protein